MTDKYIRFGTIRKYCSRIDRVSICEHETLCYENFEFIKQVPERYDQLYLYGFGIIDSEFIEDGRIHLKRCIEFSLSKTPRSDIAPDGGCAEGKP